MAVAAWNQSLAQQIRMDPICFACGLTGGAGRQGDENRAANRLAPAKRALKAKGALFLPVCR